MKERLLKILCFAAPLVTMGATLLSNWADQRNLEETIDEKINEALAEREEKKTMKREKRPNKDSFSFGKETTHVVFTRSYRRYKIIFRKEENQTNQY